MIWDIREFGGLIPRIDPKMLPPSAAQVAVNCKLWNGVLSALKAPNLIATTTKAGTIQSFYRLPYGGSDFWLHWVDDVNAVRGPVPGDTTKKLFYTGDGEPRVTHAEMASSKTDTLNGSNNYPGGFGESVATDYPRAFYALGLHPPVTAPLLGAPSGGSGTDESRAYVYTFADDWGWESGPSPPSVVQTGKPNGSWPLTQLDIAPLNTGVIVAASASGTIVTVYCSAVNWLKKGHQIVVAAVVGLTDLNAAWTVYDALNLSYTTVSRTRAANVATLVLSSVVGLAVGQTVVVSGVGGASYNATVVLTGVNTTTKAITYANVAGNEGTTADTAGKVVMAMFKVESTTVQAYTSGGTWTREAPYNVTNMTKRIYRLLSGTEGQDFKYTDEIDVATTTYTDTKLATDLGETLRTADPTIAGSAWDMPLGDMTGVVSMPGGFLVGFRENEVCFSEPNAPYAWPARYRRSTDFPIVALGTYGATISVLTSAVPYNATGYHPESMALSRGAEVYPCVSKRSVVSGSSFGVLFATDRGLAQDTGAGCRLISEYFYDREKWQDNIDLDAVFSVEYDGRYYGFWPIDADIGGSLIFDPVNPQGAISTNDFVLTGTWFDPETGSAYIVDDEGIKEWDADDAHLQVYEWLSRKRVERMPIQYKAAKLEFDVIVDPAISAAIEAANVVIAAANAAIIAAIPVGLVRESPLGGAVGGASVGSLSVANDLLTDLMDSETNKLQFELYGDGVLVFSKSVTDTKPFRIPDGKDYSIYEARLVGNVNTHSVQIAPTMSELAAQ